MQVYAVLDNVFDTEEIEIELESRRVRYETEFIKVQTHSHSSEKFIIRVENLEGLPIDNNTRLMYEIH